MQGCLCSSFKEIELEKLLYEKHYTVSMVVFFVPWLWFIGKKKSIPWEASPVPDLNFLLVTIVGLVSSPPATL